MEIRQLKYFVTIAATKSYSEAAKILFVTQPTLSWNIQQLEEEFDTRLFFHTRSGLQLTEGGEKLYRNGQEVLREFENLIDMMQQLHIEKQALRVGMTVLFAIQYMEQIVQFSSIHPDVELSFVQSGSIAIQKMVAEEEVDIGLVSFPIYEPSIEISRLKTSHGEYGVSVVVPLDHPLASKKTIRISDLKGHPICSFSEDFVLRNMLEERCAEYGFKPNIIFSNKSWEVLLQQTLSSHSLTIMPQPLQKLSTFKGLKWIPLKDKANLFEIGVAYKKDAALEDHILSFIDFLKEN